MIITKKDFYSNNRTVNTNLVHLGKTKNTKKNKITPSPPTTKDKQYIVNGKGFICYKNSFTHIYFI